MSTPYIGEIRLVGFTFAPVGWLPCDGSLQPISQYDTLYALIGTTFGGDGSQTFALPDLRGRVPLHQGAGPGLSSYAMGQTGGQTSVTLTANQVGAHSHPVNCQSVLSTTNAPAGAFFGILPTNDTPKPYVTAPASSTYGVMGSSVSPAGGSLPHDNMQPYLVAQYCIATEGIYPSQS